MTIQIKVPDIGLDEVEVTEILVNIGDQVKIEQSLITVEGNKASMEIPAPFPGVVKEININVGDKISTGTIIMVFDVEDMVSESCLNLIAVPEKTENIEKTEINDTENEAYVYATPVIRNLAREFGINLANIKGTGRKGRIVREDVQTYIRHIIKYNNNINNNNLIPSILPEIDFSKFGEIEIRELGKIQKISSANLYRNWTMIPHVTQFDEANITDVEEFRQKQNIQIKQNYPHIKITLLSFIIKSVAQALKELPIFNSSLSVNGQQVILKKYVNIGIAVDTQNGLVVPVCHEVNKKGIIDLSREIISLSEKAHAGKLMASDMEGGCFTISSLGGIGGMQFTPIVNAPEVAILGVSKSYLKQVWTGKNFISLLMLPLSLSYDHRVINGADGARFIKVINNHMSNIRNLIL
ncbi:2-oxo acid dehydrogenase subunit E2 [Candidatus Palibaumannia cicadellinicola]|uniref:Dihydrolipoamide acetyltransferase component of pyruvate dehydrogenase complex n=1 Tax=Candidatus Palibaumannia cicadellinicola TaxID=186490 RepID=A0A088MYJ0_9GAMM|nr:2-oxo acid dehydrogenase subunit E2 [Candidatus Baumannia cicadellinicola]AIN47425.1 Dihydrolipoamide acetyltransferase component of pyruvate dehydrogenase complex [Candidatus Baumannia cicadellinicola]